MFRFYIVNEGPTEQISGRQYSSKSITSALVGIAIDRGDVSSVNQKKIEFFPELLPFTDPRKNEIRLLGCGIFSSDTQA